MTLLRKGRTRGVCIAASKYKGFDSPDCVDGDSYTTYATTSSHSSKNRASSKSESGPNGIKSTTSRGTPCR